MLKGSKLWILFCFVLLLVGSCGTNAQQNTRIGAILDSRTRMGREEKVALEIAVQYFNNNSKSLNLSLHVMDHTNDPLLSLASAQELIKNVKVKAIIGPERWEETALVADYGNPNQIPVISFASRPSTLSLRRPLLVHMSNNDTEQIKCVAEIVHSYRWRKVIAIYETNLYGADPNRLTLLSENLRKIGSEIEYLLVLPEFSTLLDPQESVINELRKVLGIQSRVFIVLHSSLSMSIHLFREAMGIGLIGSDAVWIVSEEIANFFDSFNSSVVASMHGVLGIKNYYSEKTKAYQNFSSQFRKKFRSEYHDEDNFDPGIHALRAFDTIGAMSNANNSSTLLENILSSDFDGLSGEIRFEDHKLSSDPFYMVVNVVGKKYRDLNFWIPGLGFSSSNGKLKSQVITDLRQSWNGKVTWPGDLDRVPKGWMMPSNARPMVIGVPGRTSFEKFVKVTPGESSSDEKTYDGFCIELFHMVLKELDYALPYKFVPFNGSYDDLVYSVYNKTFDAIVGDITILANRTEIVDFTQPFAESGLSMVVPFESEESAWMFMKPFTPNMWIVSCAVLVYTMVIVWFLEHTSSNPEFQGSWKNQIATAVWFTCCSLFFAHKEQIRNNHTRVVVVVWLFVALVLTSSYTASLSSILTVDQLKPNNTDIQYLKTNNIKIGCDGDSFVVDYLRNVLQIKQENIIKVNSEYNYTVEFERKHIGAAFLELPYQKVFISKYCKKFSAASATYRFGGLGFVFQKGSPMRRDFSKAILTLSERGDLQELQEKWFNPSPECSSNASDVKRERLSLRSFWGLYVISVSTSTICFLLFLFHWIREHWPDLLKLGVNATILWAKVQPYPQCTTVNQI